MRQYELMLVLHADVDEERLAAVMDRVRRVITPSGGDVTSEESWGRRKLAFKINRMSDAHYHIVQLSVDPTATAALEEALNLADDVIRHMLVRQEEVSTAEPSASA